MPRLVRRTRKGLSTRTRKTTTRRRRVRRVVRRHRGVRVRGTNRKHYVRGRGAYTFSSSRIAQKIPQFGAGGEGVTYISNKEQLGLIKTPSDFKGNFALAKLVYGTNTSKDASNLVTVTDLIRDCYFRVNVGSELLFPWGTGIARKYEQYKLSGLIFTYESTVNSQNSSWTSMPELIMSSNDNPFLSAPTSAQDMKIQPMSSSGRVDRNLIAGIECHPAKMGGSGWKYVVPINMSGAVEGGAEWQTSVGTRQETDHGVFAIAVEGGSASDLAQLQNKTLGRLFVTYRFQLMRPIGKSQVGASNKQYSIATAKDPTSAGMSKTTTKSQTRNAEGQSIKGTVDHNAGTQQHDMYVAPNNASHPEFNKEEFQDYYEYNPPTGFNVATKYPSETAKVARTLLNGAPRPVARFVFQDVLNSTVNPAVDDCIFASGCLAPMVDSMAVRSSSSSIELHQSYIDNIGVRLCTRNSDARTRIYFLNRFTPDTYFKVKIQWSGKVHLKVDATTMVPTAAGTANKLWVHAAGPVVEAVGQRHCQMYREEISIPGSQLANTATLINDSAANCRKWCAYADDVSVTGGVWPNYHPVSGTRIGLHTMNPAFLSTDRYEDTFYVVPNPAMQTFDDMGFIEFSPLLSYGTRVLSGMASGTNAKFNLSWPAAYSGVWDTATATSTQNAGIRYGSRSITIEAITYHEMPDHFIAHEMQERDLVYSQEDVLTKVNDWENPATIYQRTKTSEIVGKYV